MSELQPFMKKNESIEGLEGAITGAGKDFIDYDPIGLPDAQDIENIKRMIRNFNAACPGVIQAFVKDAKRQREEAGATHPLLTKKDEIRRPVLTMPIPLFRDVEEAYPLMFRNKSHLAWFKKHFPMFRTR